ncbi:hypothetical protein B9Z65_7239 [Elsinoe australis]|uniref:Uncharacterized protein n=1 Tax=Elsinoe australis TaxID=40998 RepID=A0A2P7Z6A3_9PEZI|nr:hypothetical protein B9Z65_7239 [Elsinoe australis]
MRQRSHVRLLLACLFLFCLVSLPTVNAQLPNLSQVSDQQTNAATQTGGNTNSNTRGGNTASQTGTQTGGNTNSQASQTATSGTNRPGSTTASAATTSGSGTTNLFPSNVVSSTTTNGAATPANRLSGAPTLQGVGIPTMIVPYTANAPFMQKSNLPEGTVFIAVGAVLAFLGFCVIAWRGLVAWSINRSVKRAAMASIMASETKNPGGWASNPFKPAGGFYHQAPGGSTLDLHDKTDRRASRNPVAPNTASGLFFSPTASTNATTNIPMTGLPPQNNRSSTFLPAGYYASPSSQLGSGASQTTIGGAGQGSPSLAARRTSLNRPMSNMQLAPPSRDGAGNRLSSGRPVSNVSYGGNAHLHPQHSASSLQVGTGHGEDLPGSRAPSAYLEDLFENHTNPAQGGQR